MIWVVTEEERAGNIEADALAEEGADAHFETDPAQADMRQQATAAINLQGKYLLMAARIAHEREEKHAEMKTTRGRANLQGKTGSARQLRKARQWATAIRQDRTRRTYFNGRGARDHPVRSLGEAAGREAWGC